MCFLPPMSKWCVSGVFTCPKPHRLSSLRRTPPISVLLVSLLSHYSESASWHSLLWLRNQCDRAVLMGFYDAFHVRKDDESINLVCLATRAPKWINKWGFVSGFSVVTSSPNAQDGYSKSRQMDWLIHRGEGNAISPNDKPLNELMACDRRKEEGARIDNLWKTGRERRTLEVVTEGKNAWPGMNNIELSTFICLQASIITMHICTVASL